MKSREDRNYLEWERPKHWYAWRRARVDLDAGLPRFARPHGWRTPPSNEAALRALAEHLGYPGRQWVLFAAPLGEKMFPEAGERYQVFEEAPTLFREFASLKIIREAIRRFADEYGCLGVGGEFQYQGHAYYGEPLPYWRFEIKEMKKTLFFLEAASRLNLGTLRKHILQTRDLAVEWGGRVEYLNWDDGLEPYIGWDFQDELEEHRKRVVRPGHGRVEPRALVMPAFYYVKCLIERAFLRHETAPAFLWDPGDELGVNPLRLRLRPRTLIAALWCQLAQEAGRRTHRRRCRNPACDKDFPVGGEGARMDKVYCNDTCRKNHSRATGKKQHAP